MPALWRPEHSPAVVVIAQATEDFPSAHAIDLDALFPFARSIETDDGRYVLIDDPEGCHRIRIPGGLQKHGVMVLLPLDEDFGARLHSLQRLQRRLAGKRAGPPLCSLQLSPSQRARLVLQLRALDGEQGGASRREIAAVLLDSQAQHIPAIEWKNAALRKRINRIVASSVALMNGGYLKLLRGDPLRAQRFRRH